MEQLFSYAPLLMLLVGAALVFELVFKPGRRTTGGNAYKPKRILTPNEIDMMARLVAAVPEYAVLPQVAMGAIIQTRPGLDKSAWRTARNKFDRKIIDFVLCEQPGFDVLLIVELDDKTHSPLKDDLRDSVTKAAGYKTLRYLSREKPSVLKLRSDILAATGRLAASSPPDTTAGRTLP